MDIDIKAYLEVENIPFTIVDDTFVIDLANITELQRKTILSLSIHYNA